MSKKTTSLAQAKAAMQEYIKFKNQKAKVAKKQTDAQALLLKFAEENPDRFNEMKNLKLPGGYIHKGTETLIIPCEGFDMAAFLSKYSEFVGLIKKRVTTNGEEVETLDNNKIKMSAIKAVLSTEEGKKKLTAEHCVELGEMDTISIEVD